MIKIAGYKTIFENKKSKKAVIWYYREDKKDYLISIVQFKKEKLKKTIIYTPIREIKILVNDLKDLKMVLKI